VQITLGNNIVSIEDGARFVAGNRHGHPFWNAGMRISKVFKCSSTEGRLPTDRPWDELMVVCRIA